jgi:serine phosphatase RsbU (regulator of sigma subunit)
MWNTAAIADSASLPRRTSDAPLAQVGRTLAAPDNVWGLLGGLGVVALIALTDIALGSGPQLNGLFTAPPFVTAVFSGARRTAIVGAASIAISVAMGSLGSDYTSSQGFRTAGVVVAAIGAVGLSMLRQREQRQMLTLARIAEVAQLAVLRGLPDRIGPARIAVRYLSASAQAHVGGDLYEALPCRTGMRAIVGDVKGKGLEGVQLANVVVGAFRGADHDRMDLADVARCLDEAFVRFEPGEEDFATAVLVEIRSDGGLTVVNCGHPLPLVVRRGALEEVAPPAYVPPIGLGSRPAPAERQLDRGDRVLLFSDGILESRHAGRFFDFSTNAPLVAEGDPQDALDALVARLFAFSEGKVADDVALLLAEYA